MSKCMICGISEAEGMVICGDCYRKNLKPSTACYDGLAVKGNSSGNSSGIVAI